MEACEGALSRLPHGLLKAVYDIRRYALEQQTLDADQVRRLVFTMPAADDIAA